MSGSFPLASTAGRLPTAQAELMKRPGPLVSPGSALAVLLTAVLESSQLSGPTPAHLPLHTQKPFYPLYLFSNSAETLVFLGKLPSFPARFNPLVSISSFLLDLVDDLKWFGSHLLYFSVTLED